ncbi:TPA: hypothetical protein ACH3X3_003476 [Trebouxia sp. C0006]
MGAFSRPSELVLQLVLDASSFLTHALSFAEIASGISSSTDRICKQQLQKEQCEEVGPDVSLLVDDLQKQWHEKLNMHLGNTLIRPGSDRKVWWSCDLCPDGLPHIWEATVSNRTYGTGCPFCSGNAVCQHNTLARKAPEVALFWDVKKNHSLSANPVTVSSRLRAHWKCDACLHEWQAPVMIKTRGKSGCPRCAKANGNMPADGTRQKHPSFARAKPTLLQQWDHGKNRENGNFPDNTTVRSKKLIWWQCHQNAQRPWCTAGRLAQVVEPHPRRQLGALVVLGRSFVDATLWKLSVPTLLLILTLKRMVSLLLK